jgi:hypothetical protein
MGTAKPTMKDHEGKKKKKTSMILEWKVKLEIEEIIQIGWNEKKY